MKPILFNTEMVRAILAGRKTVTRRVVKDASHDWDFVGLEERPCERQIRADGTEYPKALDWPHAVFSAGEGYFDYPMRKTPYRPGDILYVRETWSHTCIHCEHYPDMFFCPHDCGTCPEFVYKADGGSLDDWPDKCWRSSIHMPREAARIFLRVTDVRVERLQDITEEQAVKEGFEAFNSDSGYYEPATLGFVETWYSTIKPADRALYAWEANPWVWVIEFERISRPEEVTPHD